MSRRNEAAGRLVASLATLASVAAMAHISSTSFHLSGVLPVLAIYVSVSYAAFCAGVYSIHKNKEG